MHHACKNTIGSQGRPARFQFERPSPPHLWDKKTLGNADEKPTSANIYVNASTAPRSFHLLFFFQLQNLKQWENDFFVKFRVQFPCNQIHFSFTINAHDRVSAARKVLGVNVHKPGGDNTPMVVLLLSRKESGHLHSGSDPDLDLRDTPGSANVQALQTTKPLRHDFPAQGLSRMRQATLLTVRHNAVLHATDMSGKFRYHETIVGYPLPAPKRDHPVHGPQTPTMAETLWAMTDPKGTAG